MDPAAAPENVLRNLYAGRPVRWTVRHDGTGAAEGSWPPCNVVAPIGRLAE